MKKNLLPILFLFLVFALSAQSNSGKKPIKGGLEEDHVQVFPNPADNFIGVSANDSVKKIIVFNLAGRKMKTFEATKGQKYFVGDLPKGIYLVQLVGSKNITLRTQRVSKR